MDKIKKGSIPALFIEIAALIVAALIIWPLLDMLFNAVFTHSEFHYSVTAHVVEPIIFGIIGGFIFWIFDRISIKKASSKK